MAVERDSRTFKQAASLARFGYRSIVLEGEAGSLSRENMPFELITIPGANPALGSVDVPPGESPARSESPVPELPGRDAPPGSEDAPPPAGRFGVASQILAAVRRAAARPRLWLKARTYAFRWHVGWNRRAYVSLPAAQLYIVHSPLLVPAVLVKAAGTRAPIAYDAHDAYFEIAPEQATHPTSGQRLWELVERLCVRWARGFVTVSDGVARILEERYGRRPDVIRNCHDLRLDLPADPNLRERLELSDDDFLLVMIGNRKEGMTVEAGLRAMAELPDDVHLAFVGRNHEGGRARLSELGLQGRVHLVGWVPPTQVASFVSPADAAVVLYRPLTRSYRSALPNGFFQGIAAGLPTLYPDTLPELAALAEHYELGRPIDPTDPDSIASAVSRLRTDRKLASRLRERADRARNVENWEQEESALARIVESAINGRSPEHGGPRARP